jgi:N-acetylmuramic acid 6-phosphate etherase
MFGDKKLKNKPDDRIDLAKLGTEQVNSSSTDLDLKSSLELAQIINAEDARVAQAVQRALPEIARAIDLIANAIKDGGRLIYVGAGTSGRIAALDASECPPTFSTKPETVQFVMAGGSKALANAAEGNEDSRKLGERELAKKRPTKKDVVVGIAASGRTPFTVAAIEFARKKSAVTVAVTCNQDSPLGNAADISIVTEVGPEALSGSTRMKAGTSQKMVLNMLSTGAMARLGYVFGNLMVNVNLKNKKLIERGVNILERAGGVPSEDARKTLKAAGNKVPVALVMLKAGTNRKQAEAALKAAHGNIRQALLL